MLPYHFGISQQEPNPTPGFPITMAPPAAVHPDQQQHYDHHQFFPGHGQYFNNSETLEAVLRPPRAATAASEREAVGGVTAAASRNGMVVAGSGTQGHGVRARKRPFRTDRHSKIRTAQGVRDRRMRLSLDVARDFFALQDRLGFDKASKTVDWLLTQSKPAIDRLAAEPSAHLHCAMTSSPSEAAVTDTAAGKGGGSSCGGVSKAASRSSAALMLQDNGGCELDRLVAAAPVLREYYYEFGEMMGANGGEGDDDGDYDEDGDFLDGMHY